MAYVSQVAVQNQVSIADMLSRAAFQVISALENAYLSAIEAHSRRRTAEILNSLSDAQLDDIGLSRENIDRIAHTL